MVEKKENKFLKILFGISMIVLISGVLWSIFSKDQCEIIDIEKREDLCNIYGYNLSSEVVTCCDFDSGKCQDFLIKENIDVDERNI